MNRFHRWRLLKLLSVLVLSTSIACASAELNAYRTLAGVSVAVDSAMKVYAVQVVSGKVSQATQNEVRKLYTDYQLAYAVAQAAIQTYKAAGGLFPQAQIDAAVTAASKVEGVAKVNP